MEDNKFNVRERFGDFLETEYPKEVEEFGVEYPERKIFRFDFGRLRKFDRGVASKLQESATKEIEDAEKALSTSSAHDAAYLPYPTLVPEGEIPIVYLNNLGANDIRSLRRVPIVVDGLHEAKTVVRDATFECESCEETTIVSQDLGELSEPYSCPKCDKVRVEFKLLDKHSSFVDYQELTVTDAATAVLNRGGGKRIDGYCFGHTVGDIQDGEWKMVTCIVEGSFQEDAPVVDPYLRILDVNELEEEDLPEQVTVLPAACQRNDIHPSELAVKGFATHCDQVFEQLDAETMNEDDVKMKIITPFLELLGWDRLGPEIRMEFDTGRGAVDYALTVDNKAEVLVEAKAPSQPLRKPKEQLLGYMRASQVEWGILTNGAQYRLFQLEQDAPYFEPVLKDDYTRLHEHVQPLGHVARDSWVQ